MQRRTAIIALLSVLRAAPVPAQGTDSAAARAGSPMCRFAASGVIVRVYTSAHHGSVGPVVRCGDREIVLGPYIGQDEPQYIVPTRAVQRIWVRRRASREGLTFGAASGAAVGGLFAAVGSNTCGGSPCHGNIPVGLAMGALVGGVVGWFIGSGLPHWKLVYP